jgi:ABC-type sulfate transport system substrate-binding protein
VPRVRSARPAGLAAPTAFADIGIRPVTPEDKAHAARRFSTIKFFRVGDFGGWAADDRKVSGKGAIWDQIFARTR